MEILRYRINFLQTLACVLLVFIVASDTLLIRIFCACILALVAIGARRNIIRTTRVAYLNAIAHIAETECDGAINDAA